MLLLIVFLFLALGVSFLCSVLEAVLLSVTPAYIRSLKDREIPAGKRLDRLKSDIERPLAAILSFNTIAHTVGAAGVGAQAVKVFGEAWFGVVSAVLTLLILFLSEIIPKTLGALYWRKLAPPAAIVCQWIIVLTCPLVIISKWITLWFGGKSEQKKICREEVAAMARIGFQEGVFASGEFRVIRSLVAARNVFVKDILTPRTVVQAAPEDWKPMDVFKQPEMVKYSRIPVYRGNIDRITGYVLKHELLEKLVRKEDGATLASFKRDMPVVIEKLPVPALFEQLIVNREQIAKVVDEFGGVSGIVTLEDVIETLLGSEITDELDDVEDLRTFAREQLEQ